MDNICRLKASLHRDECMAAGNSTCPKGGVSCSKDSFVVNQTLVFQIKFCGKSTALRIATKCNRQFLNLKIQ
jgi:hypothetical protein